MSIFSQVPTSRVGKSRQPNLSFNYYGDFEPGILYPVCVKHMVPGDVFKYGLDIVIKSNPTVQEFMSDMYVDAYAFFTPHRIVDDDFEESLTGGVTGDSAKTFPHWNPTKIGAPAGVDEVCVPTVSNVPSLWSQFGFPLLADSSTTGTLTEAEDIDDKFTPLAYPLRSYNRIWNEYFRDENLQVEVVENEDEDNYNFACLRANVRKDRFTGALPYAQRGSVPTFGFSGYQVINAYTDIDDDTDRKYKGHLNGQVDSSASLVTNSFNPGVDGSIIANDTWLDFGFDRSELGSWDIEDIRYANAVQRWAERSMLCGTRYTEYLRAMYGVFPRDERLQRPEFIGSLHQPVFSSEIPQTSQTTTGAGGSAQGTVVSKLNSVASNYLGTYRALEFGTFMCVLVIRPKVSRINQGFPKEWLWSDKFDFYNPIFQHLGEDAILENEIFATWDVSNDAKVFGYGGHYDELRCSHDVYTGSFRETSGYLNKTLAEYYTSAPSLNSSFIICKPDTERIKAVTGESLFYGVVRNHLDSYRPLTRFAEERL